MMDYLDVIFGRTTPIEGLHWEDWREVKVSTVDSESGGISVELSGQVDTSDSRMMLRNRLYYAMVKYSEYQPDGSGKVNEGETKTDQKLFPGMVPTVDFEGGSEDETTGRWPFKATLTFNPIVFLTKYRIQAIEIDSCTVWSATYGTIGDGCKNEGNIKLDDITKEDGGGGQ
jgi:hypothetical protein